MDENKTVSDTAAGRTTINKFLFCCIFGGSILFNLVYFSFGAIEPHYDMMRQPIDSLQHLPHGWIQSINFIIYGASVCAFAVALRTELQSGFGALLLPLFNWLSGLGLILAGLCIHEPLHTQVFVGSFISLLISFFLFAVRFAGNPRWKGWATYTIISAVLMIVLSLLFGYSQSRGGAYAGVFQRFIVITRLLWIVAFILKLFDGNNLNPKTDNYF